MAYYHVHGVIPDTLSQSEGYKLFEQYIASGAKQNTTTTKQRKITHTKQTNT
jgi:hypothetical protein